MKRKQSVSVVVPAPLEIASRAPACGVMYILHRAAIANWNESGFILSPLVFQLNRGALHNNFEIAPPANPSLSDSVLNSVPSEPDHIVS